MTRRDFCLYFYSLWGVKEENFPYKGTVKPLDFIIRRIIQEIQMTPTSFW